MSQDVKTLIEEECDKIKALLIAKNEAYGNSALDPLRIFACGVDSETQILVRIDDKISRIKRGRESAKNQVVEDTEQDLIGYLVLLRVLRRTKNATT